MPSYFVACQTVPPGAHAVHDRSRCPPGAFPAGGAAEYLGEYLEASQALAVARLRYPHAGACACCSAPVPQPARQADLSPARS